MAAVLHGVPVNLRLDVDALGGVGLEPGDIDLCERKTASGQLRELRSAPEEDGGTYQSM